MNITGVSHRFLNDKMNSGNTAAKIDSKIEKYFTVTKCIGKGTFSVVYEVYNSKNQRKYALKKVFVDDIVDQKARADCFNEVNLLQRAKHPNIIRFIYCEYSRQLTNGTLNLVLELAAMGDLSHFITSHIKRVTLVPEKKIWKFISQLSSGLFYLHSNRIMHRDLKPANIYLSENENIKIGDFGLGKYCPSETELFATSVLGSPYYMSPERLLQRKYYFNSDVWSLGCVIYELATLQSPFYVNKLDINLLIKRVIKCDYPPLPSDNFSEELHKVVNECLISDSTKRPEAHHILNVANQEVKKYA